tara:strand:- start:2026 stop:2697 length:672 start_codon:yes stop_codon:yes gene_type:complete
MRTIPAVLFLFLVASSVSTNAQDINAKTEGGLSVLLHADGTWTVVEKKPEPKEAIDYDFRKSRWGDSRSEVIASEGAEPLVSQEGLIGYQTRVAGLDMLAAYIFVGDQLVRARYVITEKHANETDFISDYNNLKELLSNKYGVPDEDENIWKNDLFKDSYEDWGMALQVGHLVYYSHWTHQRTEIKLVLNGDNYEIDFLLEYSSNDLGKLEAEQRNAKTMDAL